MAALRSALLSFVTRRGLTSTSSSLPSVTTAVFSKNQSRGLQTSSSLGVPSGLWKLGRLNHVAIAVPNLEAASKMYREVLGAKVSEAHEQPEHGVYTVFVELGNAKIELLHPLGEKSPIQVNYYKD
jgi:hypothetical protein